MLRLSEIASLLLISVAVSWVLARRITGNVILLTAQAQQVASGDLTATSMQIHSKDEIGD